MKPKKRKRREAEREALAAEAREVSATAYARKPRAAATYETRTLRVLTVAARLTVSEARMAARIEAVRRDAERLGIGVRDELIERGLTMRIGRSVDRWLARWARRNGVVLAEGLPRWGMTRPHPVFDWRAFAGGHIILAIRTRGIEPPYPEFLAAIAAAGERLPLADGVTELRIPIPAEPERRA